MAIWSRNGPELGTKRRRAGIGTGVNALLRPDDVAERLAVSKVTVYRLARSADPDLATSADTARGASWRACASEARCASDPRPWTPTWPALRPTRRRHGPPRPPCARARAEAVPASSG